MARSKEFDESVILERAVRLFSEKGFNGISMQDIVDGLQINRSSIYDTFGDKENLFIETLKHYRKCYTQKMIDLVENSSDIKETVREIFKYVATESTANKNNVGCMMVNTTAELPTLSKKVSDLVHENMFAFHDVLTTALKKAQKDNTISKAHSPVALAYTILNSINGLRLAGHLQPDKKLYDDVMKVTLSLLD